MKDVYELDIVIQINRKQEDSGGYQTHTGERLGINQRVTVKAADFMEIAGILGRFQELTTKIQEEQA